MQLGLNKRFSRGLQFQASYQLSKNIDDISGFFAADQRSGSSDVQDPDSIQEDRGLSSYDVRHSLVLNYTYELPWGSDRLGRWPLCLAIGRSTEL